MTYKVLGSEISLPLTVESIDEWISEKRKEFDLEDVDSPSNLRHLEALRAELYRDVIFCIKQGAGHSRELAQAAWKLELIYNAED